jgi:hypothetical protein
MGEAKAIPITAAPMSIATADIGCEARLRANERHAGKETFCTDVNHFTYRKAPPQYP